MAAFRAACDPTAYPQVGAPWQPLKVYYNAWSPERMVALNDAMVRAGHEPPFADWLKNLASRPRRTVTTQVRCGEHFEARDDALRAHATQVDPDGSWFAVPLSLQREVWPFEDFELAASLVPVQLPEDDLFAGLRDLPDLDAVCRRSPGRDSAGDPVLAYATTPPAPAGAQARSTVPQDADGDDHDDMRAEEGHTE
jgi:mycothiol S-conjugate amidase